MSEELSYHDVRFSKGDTGEGFDTTWSDRLRAPDRHPKHEHIHSIDWPDELTPPFRMNTWEYTPTDKPAVRAIQMTQAVIVTSRRIDNRLETLCKKGARRLRRMQQGGDTARVNRSDYRWLAVERTADPTFFDRLSAQHRLIGQWGDEAMPRFDTPMAELYQWVDDIYHVVDRGIEAAEDGWGIHYEEGGWFSEGEWKYDPVPTDEHIERMETAYDDFVDAVYDVDLEFVVNDLYQKLETPTEADEQLGF